MFVKRCSELVICYMINYLGYNVFVETIILLNNAPSWELSPDLTIAVNAVNVNS